MNQGYPRKEKLKSKKLIEMLFTNGKSISVYPLKLIYLRTSSFDGVAIKAGVAVPKKNFKRAVHRNHIKRLVREAYRTNKANIFNNTNGKFAFLFLYLGKEKPSYQIIEAKMLAVFDVFNSKNS